MERQKTSGTGKNKVTRDVCGRRNKSHCFKMSCAHRQRRDFVRTMVDCDDICWTRYISSIGALFFLTSVQTSYRKLSPTLVGQCYFESCPSSFWNQCQKIHSAYQNHPSFLSLELTQLNLDLNMLLFTCKFCRP